MAMGVRELLKGRPSTVSQDCTIAEAAKLMEYTQGIVVCDDLDMPLGIITHRLLNKYLLAGISPDEKVSIIMKREFIVLDQNDPPDKWDAQQEICPVTGSGRVVGTFSAMQLLKYLQKEYKDKDSKEALLVSDIKAVIDLNKELDSIIDACSEGIYITDGKGVTLRVNKAWERITGLASEEVVGKHMSLLVEQGLISSSSSVKVLETKKEIDIIQKYRGGKVGLVSSRPIFDEQGNVYRVVTTIRDVTELNNLQEKLFKSDERMRKYYHEVMTLRKNQLGSDGLVVSSRKMEKVVEMVNQVARFDSTCLLQGESGVGKDLLAHLIHIKSHRKEGPFMKVNCGAIPYNLLEAELFGYEAGAFTGARKEGKPGIFELAHEGTLFLDEIGDMPVGLQVKLLQVIQDMTLYRVGGTKPIRVDVRIVSATNQNLVEMVKAGKFRRDLYFRLNTFPIEIPPLRERPEDILPLIQKFSEDINKKYGIKIQLAPEVIERLMQYHWPGNVRELRNIVERIMITKGDGVAGLDCLPAYICDKKYDYPINRFSRSKLKEAVYELEKHLILKALDDNLSLSKAAQKLGVNYSTIYRKVRKYHLPVSCREYNLCNNERFAEVKETEQS